MTNREKAARCAEVIVARLDELNQVEWRSDTPVSVQVATIVEEQKLLAGPQIEAIVLRMLDERDEAEDSG